MGRQNSMAVIDTALQGPLPSSDVSTTNGTPSAAAPHPAPGVDAPTPLTADQKRGFDVARTARLDEEKTQKNIVSQQEDIVSQQQKELQTQQKNEDIFRKSAFQTVDAASSIVKNTGVRVENLPTPGSLILPLVVLAVFFFLLLPVNGHTRLVWIWLVLSGNADISNGGNGSGSSVPDTSSPSDTSTGSTASATGLAGAATFTMPFVMPAMTMTGVEGS